MIFFLEVFLPIPVSRLPASPESVWAIFVYVQCPGPLAVLSQLRGAKRCTFTLLLWNWKLNIKSLQFYSHCHGIVRQLFQEGKMNIWAYILLLLMLTAPKSQYIWVDARVLPLQPTQQLSASSAIAAGGEWDNSGANLNFPGVLFASGGKCGSLAMLLQEHSCQDKISILYQKALPAFMAF